jgi:hypothetical protein
MKENRPSWEVFQVLILKVLENYKKRHEGGIHDFWHDALASKIAGIIVERDDLVEAAQVAGWIHSTDRLFPEDEVEDTIRDYLLSFTAFSEEVEKMIIKAILYHSKLNDPSDNLITRALKDADRLASGHGSLCLVRTGQANYLLPTFNPSYIGERTPGATYLGPITVLDSLKFVLEWQEMLRCPKAIELGKVYFGQLRQLINDIESHVAKMGLCDLDAWLKIQTGGD